ncbi:hypothetical protein J6590_029728 [Homalodisca vitripennis]|nr:hypothetical protein J6590_029728 [Homalodisca vitripennis]
MTAVTQEIEVNYGTCQGINTTRRVAVYNECDYLSTPRCNRLAPNLREVYVSTVLTSLSNLIFNSCVFPLTHNNAPRLAGDTNINNSWLNQNMTSCRRERHHCLLHRAESASLINDEINEAVLISRRLTTATSQFQQAISREK